MSLLAYLQLDEAQRTDAPHYSKPDKAREGNGSVRHEDMFGRRGGSRMHALYVVNAVWKLLGRPAPFLMSMWT
jgi:hypothetical protein